MCEIGWCGGVRGLHDLGCSCVRAEPTGGDAADQNHELQPASHGGWLRSREGSYSDRYALGRREEERDVAAAHLGRTARGRHVRAVDEEGEVEDVGARRDGHGRRRSWR